MNIGDAVRVLMVEDNPVHVDLCSEFLPREEYSLEGAYSGREAMTKLDGGEYDVITIDYTLPDMNGLDLLRVIKDMGIETPMIFISATDDPDIAYWAMRAGASDYMVKTYHYYKALRERIDENLLFLEGPGAAEGLQKA